MNYNLTRTRYLAVVGDMPTTRQFQKDTRFRKQAASGEMVFLEVIGEDGCIICINKEGLRDDFESDWGNTSLLGRTNED